MNEAQNESATLGRSVAERVRAHVSSMASGEPFSVRELLGLGPRASIDQALSRMARGGEIERVARGFYARPLINETLGRMVPVEPEKVVAVIARTAGATVNVHGAEAARRFGLTTQMPMRKVYATTGRSRSVQLSTGKVTFVHSTPSRMGLAGTPAGEALSALLYLGKSEVSPSVVEAIRTKLGEQQFTALRSAAATTAMPAWLSDSLYEVAGTQAALSA